MTPAPTVAILGAGTMGHGIAYVASLSGCRVVIVDTDAGVAERGLAKVRGAFDVAIERGKSTAEQRDAALQRFVVAANIAEAVANADIVIEAVPEHLELKRVVFAEVERHARPDAVLASNTSSLPISEIGRSLVRRDRFVGLHFFNPVPSMRLVEIVRGADTSDETLARAARFAESLGKTPIVVRDSPGFATSRLGVVLGLEAMRMVEQGVATVEDIDRAMELGYNHPMGPLKLSDVVGLDVRLAIAEHLHATLRADIYEPPAVLRRMVGEGRLGKKSGQGFYRWEA